MPIYGICYRVYDQIIVYIISSNSHELYMRQNYSFLQIRKLIFTGILKKKKTTMFYNHKKKLIGKKI